MTPKQLNRLAAKYRNIASTLGHFDAARLALHGDCLYQLALDAEDALCRLFSAIEDRAEALERFNNEGAK